MKGPIGRLEILQRFSVVALDQRQFDFGQMGGRHPGGGMTQGDHLERGAHLDDFSHRGGIERSDPDATARYADHEMLGFELAKSFPHRDMARTELPRDVVLPEWRVRCQGAGNDLLGNRSGDPRRDCDAVAFHRLSMTNLDAIGPWVRYHRNPHIFIDKMTVYL